MITRPSLNFISLAKVVLEEAWPFAVSLRKAFALDMS
jgi:hypothetical protein